MAYQSKGVRAVVIQLFHPFSLICQLSRDRSMRDLDILQIRECHSQLIWTKKIRPPSFRFNHYKAKVVIVSIRQGSRTLRRVQMSISMKRTAQMITKSSLRSSISLSISPSRTSACEKVSHRRRIELARERVRRLPVRKVAQTLQEY